MKPEAETFRIRENNIFKDINSTEELTKYYRNYVKEYGTSYWINDMYARRMSELDIIENYRKPRGMK